jgi:hypothetical protein
MRSDIPVGRDAGTPAVLAIAGRRDVVEVLVLEVVELLDELIEVETIVVLAAGAG